MYPSIGSIACSPGSLFRIARAIAALACLIVSAGHVLADEVTDSEQLFVCGAGDDGAANESLLELRAVPDDRGTYTRLAFYGFWPGQAPIHYPSPDNPDGGQFRFANSDGPDGYVVTIRFWIGNEQFRLYSVYTQPKPGDDDIGGGQAGLEIVSAAGATRTVPCQERPYMFISSLRDAMQCDSDTALGAAACNVDNVPLRKPGSPLW